jgi:hypothetical protein
MLRIFCIYKPDLRFVDFNAWPTPAISYWPEVYPAVAQIV